MKETHLVVFTYEEERWRYFAILRDKAKDKYNRLQKKYKDTPYLYASEEAVELADAGRELQFYEDVVKMLDRKQIEGKHELSESIYMSGYGLLRKDCDDIAEQLSSEGYRKQSDNVIELPCKMGDTLYMPWEWNGQKGIACLTVTVIRCICGFGWSFGTDFDTDDEDYYEAYNCGSFKLKDFGKIIFLTREEAEAKMKGGAK